MRDPKRLDTFYDALKEYHKEYVPDWRFGQLLYNFMYWLNRDLFFIEDDKMLDIFEEYFKNCKYKE